jgi:hypothetical protein
MNCTLSILKISRKLPSCDNLSNIILFLYETWELNANQDIIYLLDVGFPGV